MVLVLIYTRALRGRGITLPSPAKWAFMFIMMQVPSILFVAESRWYLVFVRSFSLWLGGFFLFILATNLVFFESRTFFFFLKAILFTALLACIVALLAVSGFLSPSFTAPVAKVLPAVIVNSEFAYAILHKSWVGEGAARIFGLSFIRPRSFFLYANTFAGFLVLIVPLAFYLYSKQRRIVTRWLMLAVASFIVISLLLTTSRAGIASLLIGAVVALRHRLPTRVKVLLTILFVLALTLGILLTNSDFSSIARNFTELIEGLVTARGRSHITRLTIYTGTLKSWQDNPLFGWGTQRNASVAGLPASLPPLGSHSTFLAILYRHGLLGLVAYLLLIISVFRRLWSKGSSIINFALFTGKTRAKMRSYFWTTPKNLAEENREFLLFAKWSVVSNLAHSILLEVDLDATLLMTMWLVWALVVVATRPKLQTGQLTREGGDVR